MNEEERVLKAYQAFQQAMIDKDIDLLYTLVTPDKTFKHMSGHVQSKEEFFNEIEDGTLNYYKSVVHDPRVVVDGDFARLVGKTTLTAKVYGMKGTWTLNTDASFVKINGEWIQCNG